MAGIKKSLSRAKVYWTYLLFYLLIFMLPMLVLFYSSNKSLALVGQQLESNNRLVLEQFSSGMDPQLLTILRVTDQLAFNSSTGFFSERDDLVGKLTSKYSYQNVKNLLTQLSNINAVNNQIQNCYIFYTSSDRVLSYDGIYDSSFYFDQRLADQFDSFEKWINYLSEVSDSGFVCNSKWKKENQDNNFLSYVRRIQWGKDQSPYYVVMTLNKKFLDQQISVIKEQVNADVEILSPKNELLYTSAPEMFFSENYFSQGDYGSFINDIHGTATMTSWVRSGTTGCIYLVSISHGLYSSKLRTAVISNRIMLLVVLLVGVLISILLSKKSYSPIRALREFIHKRPANNIPSFDGDDFRYLRDVFKKLESEKKEMEQKLSYQYTTMKSSLIERLLFGDFTEMPLAEDKLAVMDIQFDSTDFAVVVLQAESKNIGNEELIPLLEDGSLWTEILGRWFNVYTTRMEDLTVLLVNFRSGSYEEQKNSLKDSMILCNRMVHERFEVSLSLYVSDIYHTFAGIHKAFRDTLFLSDYYHTNEGEVFSWEKITNNCFNSYYSYRPETEQKLINLIIAGEIEEAKKMITDVHIENVKNMPPWFEKVIIIDLLSSCVKAVNMVHAEKQDLTQIVTKMRQLLHEDPEKYSMSAVLDILDRICEITGGRYSSKKSVGERVRSIIYDEYTNSGLGVASIAQQLNINPSYASSLYKKCTGESIVESINNYRLNKAIELLLNSTKEVKDIAVAVGYYNSAGFIRAFKKYRGVTPGQYRNMYKEINL